MEPKIQRALSDIHLTDLRYRISYFVPHPDQDLEEATPFQGATEGLVDTAAFLEWAMTQPADIRELTASWSDIAFFRMAGLITHRILPIEHSALIEAVKWPSGPLFRCIISSAQNAALVDGCIAEQQDTWLHVSTEYGPGRQNLRDFSRRTMLEYVVRRLNYLERDDGYAVFVKIAKSSLTTALPPNKRITLPRSGHNLTRPNEIALQAFGCKLPDGPESPGTEKRAALWMYRSADFVLRQRQNLLDSQRRAMAVNAILLTLPAVYRAHGKQEYVAIVRRALQTSAPISHALRMLLRPTTYLWHIDVQELDKILQDPACRAVIGIRQQELALYTAALIRISAESLLPVLRLLPPADRSWGHLKHLAECARRSGVHSKRKLARLLRNAQLALEVGLDEQLMERLRLIGDRVQGIKIVSDLPLEWLRVGGVPLMLRHECSRIPVVPASLSYAIATDQDSIMIPPSHLTDILVIRSFAATDRIRSVLEDAFQRFPFRNTTWEVKIRFVDVETADQFVDALNAHSGAIVIFDCHGAFEPNEYLSSLQIGTAPVHLWELRKRIRRMPPIVLLSACDTLPVDGSHASVATSMLLLGARTVVATLLPINAVKGAIFLARLVFRIGEFVPIALNNRRRINWREVVAGMTKMLHVTEVLWHLAECRMIDRAVYDELHMQANGDINNLDPAWFEKTTERLSQHLGCSLVQARKHLTDGVGLTDALAHVQLGHPEVLWLVGSEAERLMAE